MPNESGWKRIVIIGLLAMSGKLTSALECRNGKAERRLMARTDEHFLGTMDIKVIWPDGEEERALALAATCGLGIGDLVSKVLVERCGEKVFIPCHKAKEIWIESFGERVMIREAAPVTVNMLQR